MGDGVMIRPALATEMTTVAALFRGYADQLGVDLSYQGFEAELAGLPGSYAPPAGLILLAVSDSGEPVGCVAVRAMAEDGVCEMKRLYVRPDHRGSGAGRALAAAAIVFAGQAGYCAMRLDTLPTMKRAAALYRTLGFVETAPYYETPVAGTIFMSKALV